MPGALRADHRRGAGRDRVRGRRLGGRRDRRREPARGGRRERRPLRATTSTPCSFRGGRWPARASSCGRSRSRGSPTAIDEQDRARRREPRPVVGRPHARPPRAQGHGSAPVPGRDTGGRCDPVDLDGVDYLVAHSYKWLLSPRGLCFFYVRARPAARDHRGSPAGSRARIRSRTTTAPRARRRRAPARHLHPLVLGPGARASLELIAALGPERIGEHNLALARPFAAELGL